LEGAYKKARELLQGGYFDVQIEDPDGERLFVEFELKPGLSCDKPLERDETSAAKVSGRIRTSLGRSV